MNILTTILNASTNIIDDSNEQFFSLSTFNYILDIIVSCLILIGLPYLTFSIIKRSQNEDDLENIEQERLKVQEKIMIKNQIEIVQNGIVCIDNESYIIPARKNLANHRFDDDCPKIKHLNSVKYEIYDIFDKKKQEN